MNNKDNKNKDIEQPSPILLYIKERWRVLLWVVLLVVAVLYFDAVNPLAERIKEYQYSWQTIVLIIAAVILFPITGGDSKYISSISTKTLLSLSKVFSGFRYIFNRLHYIPKMLLAFAVIYIIVRSAITGDNAVDLLERSIITNGIDEWKWLIAFITSVVALSLIFAFMEKILVFQPVYNEYDEIDRSIRMLRERIQGAEDQLIQTSVLTINNNKEETLGGDKYKLLDRLSISKTDVYKYEEESLKTIVLSKTLFNDTYDLNLHRLIIDKLHSKPKSVEYKWFSDKQGLDDTIKTLMEGWFDYMMESPKYSLIDIWNSRNFKIEFRKVTSAQHLLLHDINIYHYTEKHQTQAIGFLDEVGADGNEDDLVTHYVKLNINNIGELIETLQKGSNSESVKLKWKQFVIDRINEEDRLWRVL